MHNPEPRIIKFDDISVTVRMMDDSWIINRCVSHSPFIPKAGVVWSHKDRCGRLRIPGDQFENVMRSLQDTYGNAAVLAWDGDVVLGHVIFAPKQVAKKWNMLHAQRMPDSDDNDRTLVVEAVGFCSIGGRKYRRRGIGGAMAEMMIEWARGNGWTRLQVFGVPSGLFPGHWLDSCMPPKSFWEQYGFKAIHKIRVDQGWDEIAKAQRENDPRHDPKEMEQKRLIVEGMKNPRAKEDDWAYEFDMDMEL